MSRVTTCRMLLLGIALLASGCARGPETDYGSDRGASLNGTNALAAMFRGRGDEVRTAIRVSEELGDWARGIVRFAPYPGPPSKEEADWFRDWLANDPTAWLIYVVRDFDTAAEYWQQVRDGLADSPDGQARRELAEEKRAEAENWVDRLPAQAKSAADPNDWFAVESAWRPPRVCTRLSGPWAEGIDAAAVGLTLHEALQSQHGSVLLEGDGKPFVLERSRSGQGRVLVIANGSFLLNEALAHPARRPLAQRVLEWTGREGQTVALVEGAHLLAGQQRMPTMWELFERLPDLRWASIHLLVAGLIAALARAPRLGRPRPEARSGADRPAAHAEALGSLLERSGAAADAAEILERYRRWRHPRTLYDLESARSAAPPSAPPLARPQDRPRGQAPAAGGVAGDQEILFID